MVVTSLDLSGDHSSEFQTAHRSHNIYALAQFSIKCIVKLGAVLTQWEGEGILVVWVKQMKGSYDKQGGLVWLAGSSHKK